MYINPDEMVTAIGISNEEAGEFEAWYYSSGISLNNSPTGTSRALLNLSNVSNLIDDIWFVTILLKFL